MLRAVGTLDSTLRHELLHILVESHAKTGTPLWYREGLVLYLAQPNVARSGETFGSVAALEKALHAPTSEQELRQAYADAQERVAKLAREHGKETLVNWLKDGIPTQ